MKHKNLILTFLLILLLSLLLTWPLPQQLATHAPGDGSDDPAIMWNLWWVYYSLTELGQSPFESAWMFWPIGINLVFYTLTTLNGLLSIPIQLAFGLVPANSFIVYFELVVAAFGMWLFVRWVFAHHLDAAPFSRQTRDAIALLAAIVYAFSTSKWLYLSLGQFNIASSHWLPWAVLYLSRMWTATEERNCGLRIADCGIKERNRGFAQRAPVADSPRGHPMEELQNPKSEAPRSAEIRGTANCGDPKSAIRNPQSEILHSEIRNPQSEILYSAIRNPQSEILRGVREAGLCALFVLFTGWTEFTYASFFVQLAALLWLWLMLAGWKNRQWGRMRQYTLLCVLLGVLFVIGMSPILWLMGQDMRLNGDFLVEGLGFANVFSNDLLGFFVPGDQHPIFGEWVRKELNLAYLNFAFVGWVTLLLALLGLARSSTRIYAVFWALFAAIFGLISLGPTLRINGQEWELWMPFDLMLQIPLLKANRYPSRYSVIIMLCFAVLVAWGAAALLTMLRVRQKRAQMMIVAGLGALLIFEHLGAPLPLSDYRVPEVYHELKPRPGRALLELPLAWRNGFRVTGTLHNSFMFAQAFQSTHQKRLLSGNTSRNPEFKFQYFTELPVINSLLALETGYPLPDERTAQDAALAPELLRLLDTPNIIVRRLNLDKPSIVPEASLPYLERILETTRWHESEDYIGLQANLPAPPDHYQWDATHPLARLFFAEGWSALPSYYHSTRSNDFSRSSTTGLNSPPLELGEGLGVGALGAVYAQQEEAHLLIPGIASGGDWVLSFESWLPEGAESPVTIVAADPAGGRAVTLGTLTLRGTEQHAITIPATAPRGPLTEIIFYFERTHPAEQFITDSDPITSTGSDVPISLLVESAGLFVGNFAHIYLNGVDLITTSDTGYHIALISPEGNLLTLEQFNTFSDPNASRAIAALIEQAPQGTIVAIAAADTVSGGELTNGEHTGGQLLGNEAIAALASLGSTQISDLRGCYACSHAFIGVKGAAPSSALEDNSPIRPARVSLGPPLQRNTVAVGIAGFRLQAVE
ncbi:MAG: interleukin-like EMT inducer domain-containing protein [Ardenticatenaceae bacterium]